ncbi:TPA: helix-turn-helix transcriptional regulator [Streptococcus suis]|uniref:helix-turn-helix transcriptional regulator n=1 Tax=Streptococcus suis TaxID=1307 RepID=UPI000CF3F360|nr:helix-turn-helix transcriptional regulator [Streptococcus suis]HEM3942335.1 helix-turn-helix transcriptional regulator [Streptococcus suis]HEM3952337.1 helix-turn-helix transcriptional regulator [Streptococcus suis]HEM4182309.1 helix-turn-helix transcriptional regulator [Streptococcus suis]HEM4186642.1 helix-turn-helix transcriptional regulator [Streptococcus suis]
MNKLKELRAEQNLSQKDLADIFGVSEKTILRWEKGTTDIKTIKAKELAEHFNVTVPYLLGYSEIPNQFHMESDDDIYDEQFSKRIVEVLGEKFFDKLNENYIENRNSDDPDYSKLGPLRNAVISLSHLEEEELLLYFAVLSRENKTSILTLMKNLVFK